MQMRDQESLESYITRFEILVNELRMIDEKPMDEEDKICILMMGLTTKYDTVVSIIENMTLADLTYEVVKRKLKNVDEKSTTSQVSRSNEQMSFQANTRAVCHYCKKPEYLKRDCFAFKNRYHNQRNRDGYQGDHNYDDSRNKNFKFQNSRNSNNSNGSFSRNTVGHSSKKSNMNQRDSHIADVFEEESESFMAPVDNNVEAEVPSSTTTNPEVSLTEKLLVFYMDSGCTDHMVREADVFASYRKLNEPIKISVAKDGESMEAVGIGTIKAEMKNGNSTHSCVLNDVFHVPLARKNLLSVKKVEMSGLSIVFSDGDVRVLKGDKVIGIGCRKNLYELHFLINRYHNSLCCDNTMSKDKLWHWRYGHLNFPAIKQLIDKNLVDGMDNFKVNVQGFCEPCIKGKMTRLPFSKTRTRANDLLKIVHSDVCGPMDPVTHNGFRYILTFLDDYSHFLHVYLLRTKSEVCSKFKEYFMFTKSLFNKSINRLRCDNGGEYKSKELQQFCRDNGVFIEYTVAYSPEQNGKSERINRTLIEKARTMLDNAHVPKEYWSEAVYTAAYLINRSPTSTLQNVTPAELWYQRKPDVSNLKIFGCSVYFHVPKQLRLKLDVKPKKGVFLGYP